jgi:hypothetical protein
MSSFITSNTVSPFFNTTLPKNNPPYSTIGGKFIIVES